MGFFKDCLDWHTKTYCQDNRDMILAAIIHKDVVVPHMQIYSVPIINRDGKYALSAKQVMGHRKDYTDRVDSFYREVSVRHGLERGEETPKGQTAKKHLETQKYKLDKITINNPILLLQSKSKGLRVMLNCVGVKLQKEKAYTSMPFLLANITVA